jgi:type IV pilus assembly protein PilN
VIRVNLLPHREEKRKRRQQQFAVLAGIAAVIGLLVAGAVWIFLDQQVTQQQANVAYMKSEIDKLDKQIEEIRKIREETAVLLAKKQVVEGPAEQPLEPVQLLTTSSCASSRRRVPQAVKQTGPRSTCSATPIERPRLHLMRNLGASPYLENPELSRSRRRRLDKSGNR